MIVLDSDIAISLLHKQISIETLISHIKENEILTISSLTVYELYFGLYKLKRTKGVSLNLPKWQQELNGIEKLTKILPILDFNYQSAKLSADIYTNLVSKGKTIGLFDCMIASVVIAHGGRGIITGNKKHFERIENLEIIELSEE